MKDKNNRIKQLIGEQKELHQRILELEESEARCKRAEETLRKKAYELGERVKELNCVYNFSNILERPGISLPEIFQGLVDIIPSGWQYPEIACARLIFKDEIFKTDNFAETIWRQSVSILMNGKHIGTLEVDYLKEKPESDEGPFLKEERALLNELAGRLRRAIERKQAEEARHESEEKYRAIFENTGTATIIYDEDMTISIVNREAEKLSGYSKEEIEGKKKWIEFVCEDELERMKEYHRLRSTEPDVVPKGYEFCFKDRGGNIKNIFVTIDLIRESKKRVASLLDITGHRLAVEALRKSEEELKKRVKELEVFHDMINDKELEITRLKEEIETLRQQLKEYK